MICNQGAFIVGYLHSSESAAMNCLFLNICRKIRVSLPEFF